MTKILLSCNTDTYDIASTLKADIEQQLGFHVALDVEDSEEDPSENEELTEAAVLLVFQFGDESLSAWIMIEESDKRCGGTTYEESAFPEIINCTSSVARGIRILKYIMVNEFGLIVRSNEDNTESTDNTEEEASTSHHEEDMYTVDQLLKDQQQYEATKKAMKHKGGMLGKLGKIGKIFGKSGRRLSQ